MMSGTRKLPPISISSPRDTIASRPVGERVEREHERRRAVVDDERVFGAGELAEQRRAVHIARSALALRRGRTPGCEQPPAPCARWRRAPRRRQRRAAEVRVQHDARRVDDAAAATAARAPRARVGDRRPPTRDRRRAPRRIARRARRRRRGPRRRRACAARASSRAPGPSRARSSAPTRRQRAPRVRHGRVGRRGAGTRAVASACAAVAAPAAAS